MILLIACLAVAVGLGLVLGGSLRRLSETSIRGEWALILLFLLQGVVRGRVPLARELDSWSLPVWALSGVALLALLYWNRRLPGFMLMSLGLALNLMVVLANAGMPVGIDSGASGAATEAPVASGFYFASSGEIPLSFLGDVIPVPWWLGGPALASVGDVFLYLGASWFVFRRMTLREIESR